MSLKEHQEIKKRAFFLKRVIEKSKRNRKQYSLIMILYYMSLFLFFGFYVTFQDSINLSLIENIIFPSFIAIITAILSLYYSNEVEMTNSSLKYLELVQPLYINGTLDDEKELKEFYEKILNQR